MKKLIFVIAVIFVQYISYGQTNKKDSSKVSFYKAYEALKSMLEGKDSLNYEKAVFITENAYHNNYFKYEDFKRLLDFHVLMINTYAEDVRTHYKEKYKTLKPWEQKYFKMNTDNWAIFKYITDTAFVIINEDTYYKKPYSYTYQDPYGSNKWENTQVLYLLLSNEKQGNCYSLASLFKIFSDRLKSDARLTIAPHHIYIQNRNQRGDFYNVELASKSFPGDGTIQTLTYTTTTSIMRGMAQRMLKDKQAVALNLIYLAKSYQHKYNDNTSDFLLQCADLSFKCDTLSMNALLLKAEVTENRLLASMKENKITKLTKVRTNPQTQNLLKSYEEQLSNLYAIGYREIPKDIEHLMLATIQHRKEGAILKDKTPNPFASIKAKQRYATLSNGMFDEMHEPVDTIQYYHALLNTKTKKIIKLLPIEITEDYKVDPVVFALSVDPMSDKYPNISPYAYCAWNPVMLVDPNGMNYTDILNSETGESKHIEDGKDQVIILNNANYNSISNMNVNDYNKMSDDQKKSYNSTLSKGHMLDWNSELGKTIRITYAEMSQLNKTSAEDRNIVAATVMTSLQEERENNPNAVIDDDLLKKYKYDALSTDTYKNGPYTRQNNDKNNAPNYYKAMSGEYQKMLNESISAAYKSINNLLPASYDNVCSFVSPPRTSTWFNSNRNYINVTNIFKNRKGIVGVWKLKK